MEARVTLDLDETLRVVAQEAARLVADEHAAREWFSSASAADYCDTSERAIRDAERRGHLHGHRSTTGRLRFHRDDLNRFLRGEAA